MDEPLHDSQYRCRLAWGTRGAREAAARGDVLVVVDTLSFSSAAVVAAHQGAELFPAGDADDPAEMARALGAEVSVRRRDVPAGGRFSLSPATFRQAQAGDRVVLRSPNGGGCLRAVAGARKVLVGSLLNAGAVAATLCHCLEGDGVAVTIVACGERWADEDEDGRLRVALEDYLGAGAILAALPLSRDCWTPEARVCEGAFRHARANLRQLLLNCDSGRELRDSGFASDVVFASQLDLYSTVPEMQDGALRRCRSALP